MAQNLIRFFEKILGKERAHYLRLVGMFVRRELKVKYRGTFLGYIWSMLNPLLFMVILSAVLGRFVNNIPHYNIYILCGILFWNFTTLTIMIGTNSIAANGGLLKKIKVPIWVFPMVPAGTALTNFILALLPFGIVCLIKDAIPPWQIVFLPLIMGVYAIFLYGLTLIFASLNVFFRDVSHVLEPVMQLGMYATPILYARETLPADGLARTLLAYNPFTYFVETVRGVMFTGPDRPDLFHVQTICLLSISSLSLGLFFYKKCKPKIVFHL